VPPPPPELRERREAIVREHMASENVHDFDTTIGTFGHPRYELIATGEVYDGEAAVRGYYAESRTAFPDQRNEVLELHLPTTRSSSSSCCSARTSGLCARYPPRGVPSPAV
jgi:hypothetical protein